MTVILDKVSLQAGGKHLIDHLEMTVEPGQCWFVYGRNGVGKTTLLKTMAGLQKPESGCIVLGDLVLPEWEPRELAKRRAYLPQAQGDTFGFTVMETVLAARFPYQTGYLGDSADDIEKAVSALKRLEVFHLAERDIRTLSGGERQRVAVAALLAQDTPLMLLDEPASALDLSHQASLLGLIRELCREKNKAVVMVVHDLNMAWDVASHVLLLHGNGLWEAGKREAMMCTEKLSECLQFPVQTVLHGDRMVFVSY